LKNPGKASGKDIREEILHHWRDAVPNDRLAHLVRDAGRSCARALQMRLAVEGVPYGHWTFLRILWETDGLTQRELAIRAGVMTSTAFVALRAMARLGYITLKRLPHNKKNVYVHLTRKGRALQKKLTVLAEDVNTVAVRGFKPNEIATGRRLLLGLIENLAADELAPAAKRERHPKRTKRPGG
jgi:DNA-binding MarR family transcriptional regulator